MIDPDHQPTKEAFQHEQRVQFSDGRIAFGYKTPGDRIELNGLQRYSYVNDSVSTVLVKTRSGIRYALGRGIMVELPELDKSTGQFGEPDRHLHAVKLDSIPAGITDITIGESWDTLGADDPVTIVLLDYKTGGINPSYSQLDMPNPFDSAREHLSRIAQAMEQSA